MKKHMGNIVLIGAGGTGMSGVAGILQELGFSNIVCIDATQSQLTESLEAKGLQVIIGHGNYTPLADDCIIYSEATAGCEEIVQARKISRDAKKIPLILNYFQFLGEISKYFISVGFAGTNGKSSSTALAIYGAKDTLPNFAGGILGALVPDLEGKSYYLNPKIKDDIKKIFDFIFNGNVAKFPEELYNNDLIKKYYFFIEACEYKRHFLHLDLEYAIISSLELDHTDYYKDRDDYLDAFKTLIEKTKKKIYLPKELENIFPKNEKIQETETHHIPFIHLFGDHNDINGSLVNTVLKDLTENKIDITGFKGLRRRMELIHETENKTLVYSDYGHVASSILLGQQALKKKFPDRKLILIFQPHQMARILQGRSQFPEATKGYEETIIYNIYAARENFDEVKIHLQEKNITANSVNELGDIFAQHCGGKHTKNIEDIIQRIHSSSGNEVIAIFSAGDLDYLIRNSLKKI